MDKLKSFKEVITEIATKYGIQEETVEAIIIEWLSILYYAATGREPGASDDLFDFAF